MNNFYVYAYLREDGSPYYIGKGNDRRAYHGTHSVSIPPRERIRILYENMSDEEARKKECWLIKQFGRKDLNEGCLYNRTDGGDGLGRCSDSTKEAISKAQKARWESMSEEKREQISRKVTQKLTGKKQSEETKRKRSESLKAYYKRTKYTR